MVKKPGTKGVRGEESDPNSIGPCLIALAMVLRYGSGHAFARAKNPPLAAPVVDHVGSYASKLVDVNDVSLTKSLQI